MKTFYLIIVRSVPIFDQKPGAFVQEATVLAQADKYPQKGQLKLKTRRLLHLRLKVGDWIYYNSRLNIFPYLYSCRS